MPAKRPFSAKEKARRAAYAKAWAAKNPELRKQLFAQWRSKNAAYDRARTRAWQKNNPGLIRAALARRKAAVLQRTPAWADHEKINEFYEQSDYLSRLTGTKHHVDHIVPLQGKTVSGLHVHHNLQILTAEENKKKSNLHVD